MRLTVFNGSPRVEKSNTKILLERFLEGYSQNPANSHELFYLRKEEPSEMAEVFGEAENVLLAFPLYVDCMPALVKSFIEGLEPLCGREGNPAMCFLVQSGFPEAAHSRYVQRYLEKLSRRLGSEYLGTMVKGGVEGIQAKPPWMNRKLFGYFHDLGEGFGENGRLDRDILRKLAQPERLSGPRLAAIKIALKTGLVDIYWKLMLKKNDAFDKRFDCPYE